jgi:TonB family protein
MHDAWELAGLDPLDDRPDPRDRGPTASPEQVIAARVAEAEGPAPRRLPSRWVVGSLCMHALIMLSLFLSQRYARPLNEEPSHLEVFNVSAADLPADVLAAMPPEAPPVNPPDTPDQARVPLPSGQIVRLAPPKAPEAPPDRAKYLAADDHRTDRETRAKDFQVNPDVVAPKPSKIMREETEGGDQALSGGARTPRERIAMVPRSSPTDEPPRKTSVEKLEPSDLPGAEQESPEASRPANRKIDLFPSPGQVAALLGGGGPGSSGFRRGTGGERSGAPENDALDVPEGDETRLNARKFAYEKFFNAVRRQFNYYYSEASDNLSARDIGERVFEKTYVTTFSVAIRADGRIDEVRILQSSGVAAFDGVVVTAFRSGSPFPRPPAELLDEHGLLVLPGQCRLGVGMGVPSFTPGARYGRR